MPVNEVVSAEIFEFLLAVVKLNPVLEEQCKNATAITVIAKRNNQKSFGIVLGDAVEPLNISNAINGKRNSSMISKKLRALAKPFLQKILADFAMSDRICNKTWKPIPIGMETIMFKNNKDIFEIANVFIQNLSQKEKDSCLYAKQIPMSVAMKWEMHLQQNQPLVVHI